MRDIAKSEEQVKNVINDIHTSSREQAIGIEQIALSISEIERVTQRTAESAVRRATASQNFLTEAEQMQTISTRLKTMVSGAEGLKAPMDAVRRHEQPVRA